MSSLFSVVRLIENRCQKVVNRSPLVLVPQVEGKCLQIIESLNICSVERENFRQCPIHRFDVMCFYRMQNYKNKL